MRRAWGLVGLLLAFLAVRGIRRARPAITGVQEPPPERLGYDLRRGASAYAPIVGAISGFVVPAVILIFEIAASSDSTAHSAELGRSSALLTLGLIACLLSAFALAAIGAEGRLTANLTAATLYAGAATAIGIVAIIAAFEVLSKAFLPATTDLFVAITTGTAIGGTAFVAFVLADAWVSAPRQHWLSDRRSAYRWATAASGAAAVVLLGGGLSYFLGIRLTINDRQLHWLIGIGIVLAVLGGVGSAFRTMHDPDGGDNAITKVEALGVLGILVSYLFLLLLVLP